MEILKIEVYKYSIPMVPFTIATGTMHFAQNLLIRIYTNTEHIGVGECSAFPMIVGETQATCYEMAKEFATIWKHKNALDIDARLAELDLFTARNYTAKSAFDMALYDLASKHAELPLYKYLGGNIKDIESDLTIGIDTPQIMAETAAKFVADGVRMIKVKLGKDAATDIARIQKIREAVGPNIILRIDANQGWTYDDAVTALTGLGAYDIQFCEQPMRTWNDHLLPALCAISPIAIMADESVYTHHDAERIIANKACASINIKLAKSGGIKEALAINKVAETAGVPCMLGGMLESRLALSAKVHLAMGLDNVKYYDLDTCLLGHKIDPVTRGARYKGMHLELNDAHGIGADVDPAYRSSLCSL